jgi:hypothetical protein
MAQAVQLVAAHSLVAFYDMLMRHIDGMVA